MKKLLLLLLCVPLLFSCTQNNAVQDPIDAVNILFKVAETKDFKLLSLICDLDKLELIEEGSSKNCDVCGICQLDTHNVGIAGHNSVSRDGFVDMFKGGYINGEVKTGFYEENKYAEVPVILFRKNDMIKRTITLFQDNESKSWYFGDF